MQKIHQNWLQEPIEGTSYEQVPTLICGSYAYCSFARSCDLGGGGCSLQNLIFSGTGCIFKLIDVAFITFIRNGIVAWMEAMFVCLFVCWDKTQKVCSARASFVGSCVGREVNPMGVFTHGQRHKPRAYQRQRHKPRTRQSMVI